MDKPSRVGREQAATLPGYAKANVATYRHLAPSMYESTLNSSPQHGSQTAFTQRYDHYKYHGFAGKGATSSWGRNPKMAQLALWPGDT